ncbi:MAG: T9SS type A sorting domain-containing protein [Roseivirga sp.]|nr:T9SS type A sorting domain-containing protein [Roseivirga sp.]
MKIINHKISFTKTLFFSFLLMMAFAFQSQAQQGQELAAKNNGAQVKVEVFPNPATNYLTVDLSKLSLDDPKIEIRNIIGSKMRFRSEDLGGKKQRLDVQDYPPGYYLVLVRDDKTKFQQTVRFSKK